MRIVVTVKYVPDINTDRGFEDSRVRRTPEEGTLNELDENAIEAALQIIEAATSQDADSAHEVIALTVAPPEGDPALRKAFQLGVERGIRVSDDALAGADYFGTAAALAAAVRKLESEGPVDLVITGMAALDGLGSVIPTLLATELGRPALTLAKQIDVTDGVVSVTREHDDATEELSAPLPALLSVTDAANQPRLPNFKRIMAARSKQVEAWSASDIGLDAPDARTETLSAAPRPARDEVRLVTDKGEGGKALATYLIENDLV